MRTNQRILKRQANILSSIISNFETVEEVIETSMNSSGSAIAENAKYMESLQGKIDQFNNALQTFWNNLLNSEMLKKFIEAGTAILEFLNKLGPELTTIIGIVTGISGATLLKGLNAWFQDNSNSASLVNELTKSFGKLKGGIVSAGKAIGKLGLSTGIIAGIAAAVAIVVAGLKNARKEASAAALSNAKEIKEENAALEEYKEEAANLRTELDSGNLSEAEAYNARKRLIEIQSELVNMFGKEAEGINLVTGAINTQIAAIDELAVKNAQEWLTENSKEVKFLGIGKKSVIDSAKEYMTEDVNVVIEHAGDGGFKDSFKEAYGDDWEDYYNSALVQFENYVESLGGTTGVENFSFWGVKREDVVNYASQITQWLSDYQKANRNEVDLSGFIGIINTSIDDQIDTEAFDTHQQNFEAYLENTALTTYTKEYGAILSAQKELQDALTSGDDSLALTAHEKLVAAVEAAKTAAGEDEWQVNWFDGLDDQYTAAIGAINFENAWENNTDGIANSIKKAITDASEKVGHELTDSELGAMSDLVSEDFDWSTYSGSEDQFYIWGTRANEYSGEEKRAYEQIAAAAAKYGMEVDALIASLVQLGIIQGDAFSSDTAKIEAKSQSLSTLTEAAEKYNEMQLMSAEIVSDNVEISEDQYNMLQELIGSEEEFSECIDTTNGYIVTNTKLLNNLIKAGKKDLANNAKLAKSQAKLQYYELYKEMKQLTNGTKVTDAVTMNYIESLYEQMGALEKTIAKYSLLEAKLLGAANAYDQLESAQAADEAMDYGSKAEELVNVLGEAFNTAELGTEAAQVAIAGLIPDSVFEDADTLDEKMQKIYEYFTGGEISKLFTIEFDDDGNISSVEMTKENLEKYVEELFTTEFGDGTIFEGTWDEFTLNPAITSLEDFAEACNMTEEVAFAFLTSLEKYDISWLGGNFSTLLDQMMGNDLEYQYYDKMQKLADLEMKMAKGTITQKEQSTYSTLLGETDALEEQALNNTIRYAALSEQLDETKQRMTELNEELEDGTSGRSEEEITAELKKAQEEATDLLKLIEKLDEPTEFTLQLAADEVQEQIDDFKKDLEKSVSSGDKNAVVLQGVIEEIDSKGIEELGLTQTEGGTWEGLANIEGYSKLDPASKAEVVEYLSLINSQHTIDALMGNGITTVEEHLENIAAILQKTYDLMVDTTQAEEDASVFKQIWDSIQSKEVTLTQIIKSVGDAVQAAVWGGGVVNGTAHVRGTAFAGGDWSAPRTETALVGELGRELIVRNGRWFTVGDNGAEFTDIKKGDIIFNHRQTEDLLSKGYVTGRGKAYASGTAYAFERGSGVIGYADGGAYDKFINNVKTEIIKPAAQTAAVVDTWVKGSLADDYGNQDPPPSSGSDDTEEETAELFDFIEVKLEEIEAIISKTSARLVNRKDDTSTIKGKDSDYDALVAAEQDKVQIFKDAYTLYNKEADELLNAIPEDLRDAAKDGAIKLENLNEEEAAAVQEYREMAAKVDEAEVGYLEAIAQQAAYRVEQLNDIATDFDNVISLIDAESNLIQAEMDLAEESGERLSENYYKELINNSEEKKGQLEAEKVALQKILDDAVESGEVEKGTDEWYEMVNAILEVDEEIVQCDIDTEKFNNSIQDLRWDNLDKLISRFDALDSELSHIYDRLTDGDVVDEFGNWNEKGVAALGVAAQQMEVANAKAHEYGEQINWLNEHWKEAGYSEDEYNEKLAELTENQWNEIEASESAKDAIIDLNKTRIDAVKEGIEEEIDAYKELIDKKKEALDADKDLYDFEKSVAEQQKEISDIERKIAALSGDTSASAAAERKRLEAELAEAKAGLEDTFYERSIENQKNALDNEYEQFEEEKNEEMELLDKYLENEELVLLTSMNTVKENAGVVLSEIENISEEYGIKISDKITQPWEDMSSEVETAKLSVSPALTEIEELAKTHGLTLSGLLTQPWKDAVTEIGNYKTELASLGLVNVDDIKGEEDIPKGEADDNAEGDVKDVKDNVKDVTKEENPEPPKVEDKEEEEKEKNPNAGLVSSIEGDILSGQTGENVKKLQRALNELGFSCGTVDGIYGEKTRGAVRLFQASSKYGGAITIDGQVGKETKKKFEIAGYKGGTLGVMDDEWAWIDEIGEELVFHAGNNGRLEYLTKGSTVVPADITKKLIDMVVDPTQTLENSRPIISAPHIVNNQIDIDMNFGEVVHIDTVTNDTLPDLTKAVEKQLDKYMKNLNNQIRKYSR